MRSAMGTRRVTFSSRIVRRDLPTGSNISEYAQAKFSAGHCNQPFQISQPSQRATAYEVGLAASNGQAPARPTDADAELRFPLRSGGVPSENRGFRKI